MTTFMRCNRCGHTSASDEQCTWLRLTVFPSEDEYLKVYGDEIDLCGKCERDMVKWMAKPLVDSIGKKP